MTKTAGGDPKPQNDPTTTKNQLNSLGYGDDVKLSQLAEAPTGALVMTGDAEADLSSKSGRPSDTEVVKITNPLGVRFMTFDGNSGKKSVIDYRKNEHINAEACLVILDEDTKEIFQAKAVYSGNSNNTVCRTAWIKSDEGKDKWKEYQGYYKNPLIWSKGDKLS